MTKRSAAHPKTPRKKALLAALAELMNEDRLRHMANADRGEDFEAHLAAVRHIRDTLEVPAAFDWVPLEVLELTRWSRPEDWYAEPDVIYRDHYEMRAFACAALLLQGEDADSWDSAAETLGNLMESLIRYRSQLLPLVPGALAHWAGFDFHESDHAFRLAAELCVWLETGEMAKVRPCLDQLLDMESEARKNTSGRINDYGGDAAFAGARALVQSEGWHCVGKLISDQAATIEDEETRFLLGEIGAGLQAIKPRRR